jgi:hypothetical protein
LFDLSLFEILIASFIGFLRASGFAMVIIRDPVFFYVVAGCALPGPSEIRPFIISPDRPHMCGGIKIFMNMTAFAIIINNIIIFCGAEFSIEGVFNTQIGAPAHDNDQEPGKYQATDFIESSTHKVLLARMA